MRTLIAIVGLVVAGAGVAQAVLIDWVAVRDPENAADGGYGGVDYVYQIGKYEVTNAQYSEFLNAVARTDTYGLYDENMGSGYGGITQSGSEGSFVYSVRPGFAKKPVSFVNFYDALRFANWLQNGRPVGVQDETTTEDGAYTISAEGIADNSITRNAEATIFLPSEDEWYKAAYYDALSGSYFDYPVGSDTQATCALPGAAANTANCDYAVADLTDAGSYTGSASPAGTFDQGGNVWEWNEEIMVGSSRGLRGGSFPRPPTSLAVTARYFFSPTSQAAGVGLRVARFPEPGAGLLEMTSILVLAAWRRRASWWPTHCRGVIPWRSAAAR